MKRYLFLVLLRLVCWSFGVVMEIKDVHRFQGRFDRSKPRIRAEGPFKWREVLAHDWVSAFKNR